MFEDKVLNCQDCGQEFVFTAGEQEFYEQRGFQNEPKRCKACRDKKKAESRQRKGRNSAKLYDAVCSECGKPAKVPFRPSEDRPVYCKDCYQKIR
ncbi:MAG: zinc-ribbon domain containing protein [Clostridia bacterium]|nr:zinc-ribbon domain containing protein [Clostridia bacterium]